MVDYLLVRLPCRLLPCLQEVHDALVSVEGDAEALFVTDSRLMDQEAQERDRLYERAQKVRADETDLTQLGLT